ncbi:anti-sigma factor antagonist [Amycolatopsis sp. cmx-4-68]|uniref:anti-sigma factor antagonist n=1 Tax=Amycolatopsis sp. cmx-4-68 TaxID=2790938 RepID=UPI00397D5BCF
MTTVTDPRDDPTAAASTPASAIDVLILRGAGDLTGARSAEEIVAPAASAAPGAAIVLDLSAVTYLTTEAVIPLITLAHRCAAHEQSLRVLVSEPVRQKLARLGLHETLSSEPAGPRPSP